jgi:predicted Fe-Mo cluster-binding NifX family protein
MIVKKAYNMAKQMDIPILGIVENMSFLKCPDCGKEIKLFGDSRIDSIAKDLGLKVLGKMPIDPIVAELCDNGEIEKISNDYLSEAVSYIEKYLNTKKESKVMKIAIPTEETNVSSHFGKCENFTIVEIENSKIKGKVIVNTEGNQHGLLPAFLAAHGVNVVIAGGMGEGARKNLVSNNIEIISGVRGNIDEAINAFLAGTLESSDEGCSGHDHSHGHEHGESGCNCGNH